MKIKWPLFHTVVVETQARSKTCKYSSTNCITIFHFCWNVCVSNMQTSVALNLVVKYEISRRKRCYLADVTF